MTEVPMTRRRTFLRAAVSSPVFVGAACAGATRPGERSTGVPSDSVQVDATLVGGSLTALAEGPIRVAFLASQVTELVELAGPWGVFTYAAGPHAAVTFETYVVAERMEPLEFSGGLRVLPRYTLDDAPTALVVVIPAQARGARGGGPARAPRPGLDEPTLERGLSRASAVDGASSRRPPRSPRRTRPRPMRPCGAVSHGPARSRG